MLFTLISSLPIANTKRVTFSEDGCMSIELVWVLVWVSFSSSLYPISIYRFFSSLFSPSSKLRKNFTRDYQCGTRFLYWHIKPYVRIVQSFFCKHRNNGCFVLSYHEGIIGICYQLDIDMTK